MKKQEITTGNEWFVNLQIEAEKIGARVHLIELKVDHTKTLHDETGGGREVDEIIVLLNWPKGGESLDKARIYGDSNSLVRTDISVLLAMLIKKPNLNNELKCASLNVISTIDFKFEYDIRGTYLMSWGGTHSWFGGVRPCLDIHIKVENIWFAFCKKNISTPPERTTAEFFDGC